MKVFSDSLIALLILTGSASCASVTTPQAAASVVGSGSFVSDSGQTIRADYRDNGTVTLTFTDGTSRVLSQAVSASGARYVSGSYEWWEHQGEATYSVNGKQMFLGKLKQKPGV
jgi:membrane-bound inhibitor of C-type lysozyme